MNPTLLLTGARGQLGSTFRQHWPESPLAASYRLHCIDIDDLDLTVEASVRRHLDGLQPQLILNSAAYTAVDQAEQEAESAFAVNEQAVVNMARWCSENAAAMIHISTDFVFDGAATAPYRTAARTNPLSVYGASKLAGEQQLQALLPGNSLIVRTSWLYSEHGNNFVTTMLRLMNEKDELGIVDDQVGSPTSTHSMVQFLFKLIESGVNGIYHWSDGGEISWHRFASAIQQAGQRSGLLTKAIPLNRLSTTQYSTAATRPAYSVLDRSEALSLLGGWDRQWTDELQEVINALAQRS